MKGNADSEPQRPKVISSDTANALLQTGYHVELLSAGIPVVQEKDADGKLIGYHRLIPQWRVPKDVAEDMEKNGLSLSRTGGHVTGGP